MLIARTNPRTRLNRLHCIPLEARTAPAIYGPSIYLNDLSPTGSGVHNVVGVVVGDFNGDGKPDAASVRLENGDVTVFLNNGSGSLTASHLLVNGLNGSVSGTSIAAGDFNGDGKLDLAVSGHKLVVF